LRELETHRRVSIEAEGEPFVLGAEEITVALEAKTGFAAASGPAGVVVLRTVLTPELLEEGLYREVLNRVQLLRKELELEYTGRIRLWLDGDAGLLAAVRPRVEELARETLASEVHVGVRLGEPGETRELEIDGRPLVLGLVRV
jgi:isoleucyl-tRNA synthetase